MSQPASYELMTNFIDQMGVPALITQESEHRKAEETKIFLVNKRLEHLSGYGRNELIGLAPELLVPDADRPMHLKHRQSFLDNPKYRSMGYGGHLKFQKKNGSIFPVSIELSPHQTDEGFFVGLIIWPFPESE